MIFAVSLLLCVLPLNLLLLQLPIPRPQNVQLFDDSEVCTFMFNLAFFWRFFASLLRAVL